MANAKEFVERMVEYFKGVKNGPRDECIPVRELLEYASAIASEYEPIDSKVEYVEDSVEGLTMVINTTHMVGGHKVILSYTYILPKPEKVSDEEIESFNVRASLTEVDIFLQIEDKKYDILGEEWC